MELMQFEVFKLTPEERVTANKRSSRKKSLCIAIDKLNEGEYFILPASVYAAVSVRARVSEVTKIYEGKRRFSTHGVADGVRVQRDL